ncbi:hypothetical protein P153DRAFT_398555 [Dothidotthia symphoricarpi CBS 119687]|uniref:Uncharacterized protein n=1 Tax=Dothidotthia symphoricarpi CBS 119687 TaxID=1392245 RepID=A0A6A6A964_9PLEO|nr:uncharacterized protein P153DRAFT_398555 [Dothidotthia symphoricarpi CBS 119687]KAF2127201.1 hypothetical protein P153DRAFT_398555 [Dothidotthia symphoricarpi CBS 119687]
MPPSASHQMAFLSSLQAMNGMLTKQAFWPPITILLALGLPEEGPSLPYRGQHGCTEGEAKREVLLAATEDFPDTWCIAIYRS